MYLNFIHILWTIDISMKPYNFYSAYSFFSNALQNTSDNPLMKGQHTDNRVHSNFLDETFFHISYLNISFSFC